MTFTDAAFQTIFGNVGSTLMVIERTAGAADALGSPTWTDGARRDITGVVQDMSTNDLRKYAGLLQDGDLTLFVGAGVTILPTEHILWNGKRYMVVTESTETIASTPVFREYFIRRAAP